MNLIRSSSRHLLHNYHFQAGVTLGLTLSFGYITIKKYYSFFGTESNNPKNNLLKNEKNNKIKKNIKKSAVYTRTGDKGTSSLYSGERRSKTDDRFYALGATDELNASLGLAIEYSRNANNELEPILIDIQSRLFDIGASIATPNNEKSSEMKLQKTLFNKKHIIKLEEIIDLLDSSLSPLKNFILSSGGGLACAQLHFARTICRRAEREIIKLNNNDECGVDPNIMKYINRLSDFLFVSARYASYKEGKEEYIWKKED